MDQNTSLSWSGQLQDESLMSHDEDFTHLLEFGMQFSDLDGQGSAERVSNPVSMPPSSTGNGFIRMETDGPYDRMMGNFSMDAFNNPNSVSHTQPGPSYPNGNVPGLYNQDAPQRHYLHGQPPQQQQQHPQLPRGQPHQHSYQQSSSQQYGQLVIPPTPNSIELHGAAAQYPQRVDENNELYDRYTRVNDEQALFTPLISPAMTPLETQFRLPEYTIPGEYFTPLTSPALEAQNSNSNAYPPHLRQIPDVGYMQSPVDNPLPGSSAPSSPGISKKHRRRPSATTRLTGRAKKQSPSVRPQTRKKSLLNINSDELFNGFNQNQNGSQSRASGGSGLRYDSNEPTSQDSVSPESLSEPLMPPPALPPPKPSPSVRPQISQSQANEAATPATLMRIQRSQQSHDQSGQVAEQGRFVTNESHDDIMDDIALPEAATPATQLYLPDAGRIHNAPHTDATSPVTPASATPSLEPKSATADRRPSSIAPSPRTIAMPSPSGLTPKKSEPSKAGPLSRKRQGLSSTQPSPQLRPKISPNIQPLMRGSDAVSNETSAMYLASKSNYQHILDGTLLPGVSYPETLAENLTSKRTNHKLAEQGRRNRINNALKEIEALVPQEFINMKHAKEVAARATNGIEKEKEKAANQCISKASAVEMAIDYIKALKQELDETKGKLAAAETRLGGEKTSESSAAEVPDSKSK